MPDHKNPLVSVIIGAPCAGTATVFSILDVLASVGRDWEALHGTPPSPATFTVSYITANGAPYWDINGRRITPDATLDEHPKPDLVIVPELLFDPSLPLPGDLVALSRWIATAYEDGATVASVCSGALLLAEAGLLAG